MLELHHLTEKVNMNLNRTYIFHVLELCFVKPFTEIMKTNLAQVMF